MTYGFEGKFILELNDFKGILYLDLMALKM